MKKLVFLTVLLLAAGCSKQTSFVNPVPVTQIVESPTTTPEVLSEATNTLVSLPTSTPVNPKVVKETVKEEVKEETAPLNFMESPKSDAQLIQENIKRQETEYLAQQEAERQKRMAEEAAKGAAALAEIAHQEALKADAERNLRLKEYESLCVKGIPEIKLQIANIQYEIVALELKRGLTGIEQNQLYDLYKLRNTANLLLDTRELDCSINYKDIGK